MAAHWVKSINRGNLSVYSDLRHFSINFKICITCSLRSETNNRNWQQLLFIYLLKLKFVQLSKNFNKHTMAMTEKTLNKKERGEKKK